MLKTNSRSKRSSRFFQSSASILEAQLKSNPAWKGEISLAEGAEQLKSQVPFTFIISQGFDKHHYFLSYVDSELKVKHKNIRILLENGKHIYRNGGSGGYEALADLIPYCLNCSSSICKPLEN